MSLRVIHIFLMLCSIALALFMALWTKLYPWLTFLSASLVVVLSGYLVWFILKTGKKSV